MFTVTVRLRVISPEVYELPSVVPRLAAVTVPVEESMVNPSAAVILQSGVLVTVYPESPVSSAVEVPPEDQVIVIFASILGVLVPPLAGIFPAG